MSPKKIQNRSKLSGQQTGPEESSGLEIYFRPPTELSVPLTTGLIQSIPSDVFGVHLQKAAESALFLKGALQNGLKVPERIDASRFLTAARRFSFALTAKDLSREDLFVWVAEQTKAFHGTLGSKQGMVVCLANAAFILINSIQNSKNLKKIPDESKDLVSEIKNQFTAAAKKAVAITCAGDFIDAQNITSSRPFGTFEEECLRTTSIASQEIVKLDGPENEDEEINTLIRQLRDLALIINRGQKRNIDLLADGDTEKAGMYLKQLYLDGALTDVQKTLFVDSFSIRSLLADSEQTWRKPAWVEWCADSKKENSWDTRSAGIVALECSLREEKNTLFDKDNKEFTALNDQGWRLSEHRVGKGRVFFAGKINSSPAEKKDKQTSQLWVVAHMDRNPDDHTTEAYVKAIINQIRSVAARIGDYSDNDDS